MRSFLKIILPLMGKGGLAKYVFLGLLSGLCSFAFINFINRIIALFLAGNYTSVKKEYVIVVAFIILFFIWIRRTLALQLINLSQTLLWRLRKQILVLVLDANYRQVTTNRTRIQTAVINDVGVLQDVSLAIIDFVTSLILAICCLVYLFTISKVLFLITLVVALIGVAVYHVNANRNVQGFRKFRELENKFQDNLFSILNGFKEIFIDPRKGRVIYEKNIKAIASESYTRSIGAFTGYLNNQITGQILFYSLISSILLFFSILLQIKADDIVSFVFTLLYLLSAIEMVMILLPRIARAKISTKNLVDLKNDLEAIRYTEPVTKKYITKDQFSQICIKDLRFHYSGDEKSFGIGPVNFELHKGETVFIYGGNGSGKTTLIYTILGLWPPSGGEIKLNAVLVTNDNYAEYRTVFSVVFSDFHLFKEVYGIEHIDMNKWQHYLQLFELEHKVTLEGGTLSTTDLSTGQRKRLALIMALLEEKPVLVLDEWAADQDPYFRKKFYTEIIPSLKLEGISIIAITHDDRYYHCADKLYRMDYGKLTEENTNVFEPHIVA